MKILAPGFFARQNLRTPVRVSFLTVFVTLLLGLALMVPLGHAGLTLATSLGACLNASLLFWFLRRRGHFVAQPGWLGFLARLLVALAVLGALLVWIPGPPSLWLAASLWERIARLGAIVLVSVVVYFATLYLLGFRIADFNRRESR